MKIFLKLPSEVAVYKFKIHHLLSLSIGYDKNGDGRVTFSEFKRVMARTSHMSNEAIEDLVKKADVDNDG